MSEVSRANIDDQPMNHRLEKPAPMSPEQREKAGKRISPELGAEIKHLVEQRGWTNNMLIAYTGFGRNAIEHYCHTQRLRRLRSIDARQRKTLVESWSFMQKDVPAYKAALVTGRNPRAVAADYRKLRKLSDKDRAIHFAHENDYRWLTQWLAERDQPPIGKTCPKNWSTAPCRTP